ncbi:protein kinase domain-containing protein [Methylobacterium oryzihabitans]|uniref:Protein kinase domain-containing protein n=1 Tax=Methylobacterium oryzihabitans TaxID=2499852 RepID=A0A3S2V6V9_9HYPH|nr:protein kinase [Methylobacterium oryzihabitans]RVU15278.1 hypothetical protein EOE48_19775 [Methylobacterium oryzihabitans]
MSPIQNRLTVTTNTSMAEAATFLKHASDDGMKVYGRKVGDTIEIYTKSGTSTRLAMRDKFSEVIAKFRKTDLPGSHFSTKQELGRQGLETILSNLLRDAGPGALSEKGQVAGKALFDSLREPIAGQGAGLTVATARTVFNIRTTEIAMRAMATLPDASTLIGKTPRSDVAPSLERLSGPALGSALPGAALGLRAGAAIDPAAVAALSGAIADATRTKASSPAEAMATMMADTAPLAAELTDALMTQLDMARPGHGISRAEVAGFAEATVRSARENVCGIEVDDAKVRVEWEREPRIEDPDGQDLTVGVDLHPVTVGGRTYQPERFLAQGGFGMVFQYRADDGGKLVLKLPLDQPPAQPGSGQALPDVREMTVDEVRGHLGAQGAGHANILHMHGVALMPNGQFGIVIEHMPNGTASDLEQRMNAPGRVAPDGQPPASGQVTRAEAQLVALATFADMARGMQHLHDTQGVVNFDLKSPNALIGANGDVVLADFGTSKLGASTRLVDAPRIDNLFYKAPEFQSATHEIKLCTNRVTDNFKKMFDPSKTDAKKSDMGRDLGNIFGESVQESILSRVTLDEKVDTWGLGISLMELATGNPVLHGTRLQGNAMEKAIVDFGRGHGVAVASTAGDSTRPAQGSLFASSGDAQIDDLANRLLAPAAGDRIDMATALAHPALNRPGLTSPELRGLIVALAGGTADAIDTARAALAAAIAAAPPSVPTAADLPAAPTRPVPPPPEGSAIPGGSIRSVGDLHAEWTVRV